MTTTEIIYTINGIISDCTGANSDAINPTTNIKDDLAADSLELIEITIECERAFNIIIMDEEAESIITVEDLHKQVIKKIVGKGELIEVTN